MEKARRIARSSSGLTARGRGITDRRIKKVKFPACPDSGDSQQKTLENKGKKVIALKSFVQKKFDVLYATVSSFQ